MNEMEYQHEQAMKEKAMLEANSATQGITGSALSGGLKMQFGEPYKPGLRERVSQQINHAARERVKLDRLEELDYLLSKHPEVARILELVEEVR